jgi:tetratricopeptide (TPR) repeat protein
MRFAPILCLGLIALPSAAPAATQTRQEQWDRCGDDAGKYPKAEQIASCTAIIASGNQTPSNLSMAYRNRGHIYFHLARYGEALVDYDKALSIGPVSARLIADRGDSYLYLSRYGEAIADYDKALSIGPVSAQLIDARGFAHYSMGQDALARADYDQALRLEPRDADALIALGVLSERQKGYAAAVAYYDRALAIRPHAALKKTACWIRAAYTGTDLDRARTLCDEALRESPDNADYHDCRGMVGLKQERYQDAWNDFDAAARANTSYAFIPLYGRGIAERELGRAAESQADIARAKALNPKIVEIYAGWGVGP